MSALGGDMTVTSINPAGIGIFRNGTFSITPNIEFNTANVNFLNSNYSTGNSTFTLPNIGLVWHNENTAGSDWKYFNVAVTHNRLNSFNSVFNTSGDVPLNQSLAQSWSNAAAGVTRSNVGSFDQFGASLGWNAYIFDPVDTVNNIYGPHVTSGMMNQKNHFESSGHLGETNIALATSYRDKLYIGMDIGFQNINYLQKTNITNTPTQLDSTDLNYYNYNYYLNTTGNGANIKLGAIYRANNVLRLAAAIQTPTWFKMSDTYNSTVSSFFDDGNNPPLQKSPSGYYEYRLRTPWKFNFGAAAIFGTRGLISAEYDYSGIPSAKLRSTTGQYSDGYSFATENQAIKSMFKAVQTLHLGAEIKFDKLAVRIGGAYSSTPLKGSSGSKYDFSSYTLTGGLGYRGAHFFTDLSYQYEQANHNYYFYASGPAQNIKNNLNNISLTLGYKFGS